MGRAQNALTEDPNRSRSTNAALSPEGRVNLYIALDTNGVRTFNIDRSCIINGAELLKRKVINTNGLSLSIKEDNQTVDIAGLSKDVVVEVSGFEGWAAKVPTSNTLCLRVDGRLKLMDFSTPLENQSKVSMRFADGGKAELGGGSQARFDIYPEESYYFSGRGKVYAVNSDGRAYELAPQRPPMAGGSLVEVTGDDGKVKRVRKNPMSHLFISGLLGGEITIAAGHQMISLAQNQSKTLQMPNGSEIEIFQNPETRTLDWRVAKGYFQFTLAGMDCWGLTALTEQRGAIQWELSQMAIDVRNRTPEGIFPANQSFLVDLTRRVYVSVGPFCMFQYAQGPNCARYNAVGVGKDVQLFNENNGTTVSLSDNRVVFGSVSGPGADASISPTRTVRIVGSSGAPITLHEGTQSINLTMGNQQNLGTGSGTLEANYDINGNIVLHSTGGNFQVQLANLPRWVVQIADGNTVGVRYYPQQGTLFINAGLDNIGNTRVSTPDGMTPYLGPGASVSFVVGSGPSQLVNSSGSLMIDEGAGADPASYFSVAPNSTAYTPFERGSAMDTSRIIQPPISTLK